MNAIAGGVVAAVLIVGALLFLMFGAPILIVPLAVLAVLAFGGLALLGRLRDAKFTASGPGPSGVPTTGQASYDPRQTK
jgi:hypothetical protein